MCICLLKDQFFSLNRRFIPPGKEGDAAGPEWLYNLWRPIVEVEDAWLPPSLRNLVPHGGDPEKSNGLTLRLGRGLAYDRCGVE